MRVQAAAAAEGARLAATALAGLAEHARGAPTAGGVAVISLPSLSTWKREMKVDWARIEREPSVTI